MKRLLLAAITLLALAIAFVGNGVGTPLPGDDPPGPPGGSRYEDEPSVVLSVSADGRATSALPPLRPVRFRTVAAGGIASSFDRRTSLIVRSERRWRKLWRQLTAGHDPVPEPPRVDFTREKLLLVTQGRRPEGDDRVRIASVGDTGSRLEVHVTEYASADDCAATDVHQYPYHVVRLPRSGPHRAHVVRFREVAPCGPSRP